MSTGDEEKLGLRAHEVSLGACQVHTTGRLFYGTHVT